ncbi:Probable protein phosphatase 2C 35 [Linum perenne]
MGCVHGRCCSRYPSSSEGGGSRDYRQLELDAGKSKHLLTQRSLETVSVPSSNFRLQYSVLTQRGYYPDQPDKENEDSFVIKTQLQGNPDIHFFGVFDGHGQFGAPCSNFVKNRLVEILENDATLSDDPIEAYNSAFSRTNLELHNSGIDDTMSGTTAITVLVIGCRIYTANVGDSRAVMGVRRRDRIVAEDLSSDQTPFRKDECERVKQCGARVLSVDQVEGLKDPNIQSWGDEENDGGDPPRLWVQDAMYPGTAFTRSVGDGTAERIGVIAEPEVSVAARYGDPRDACSAIAGESYKLWLEHENRTDDITIIIAQIKDLITPGVDDGDRITVTNRIEASPKGSADLSIHTESDVYQSIRTDLPDLQGLASQSPVVVPDPHQKPLEVVSYLHPSE